LKKLALLAGFAAVCGSANAVTLWYNGDFNGVNGGNVGGFSGFDSRIYEDFNVTGAGWNVTGAFMNILWADNPANVQTMEWEIRSGVTLGSGGTLVASGSSAVTMVANGMDGFGFTGYNASISGLNVNLGAGTYWFGGKFNGAGTNNSIYVVTTSGAGAVGTPAGNNGNSFWDSTTFGQSWAGTDALFGPGSWDVSMGVQGSVVPEPATMAALGLGVAALIRRRRK
jgi:hypothetical protein